MEVTSGAEQFFTDNNGQRHSVCVVLDLFCAMQYINDLRTLSCDEQSKARRRSSPREADVQLKCAAARSRADHRKQKILHVVSLKKSKPG